VLLADSGLLGRDPVLFESPLFRLLALRSLAMLFLVLGELVLAMTSIATALNRCRRCCLFWGLVRGGTSLSSKSSIGFLPLPVLGHHCRVCLHILILLDETNLNFLIRLSHARCTKERLGSIIHADALPRVA
jgi:hypothetical protein